jgi:hypothetical protein
LVHLECDCEIIFLLVGDCVGGELAILRRSKAPCARQQQQQQLARRVLIEEDDEGDEENSFPLDYE